MPNVDGTSSQVLTTYGNGISYWGTGGGGAAGVSSIIAGTGISVDQATGNVTITNTGGGSGTGNNIK